MRLFGEGRRPKTAFISLLPALFFIGLIGGCGRGGAGMAVEDAWARPAKAGMTSAAYFVVHNRTGSGDALISAETEVGRAEIHATVVQGGEGHGDTAMDHGGGAMRMRPVDRVEVPAGGTVEFRPGGYHVMLRELKRDLKVGDRFRLTLNFEKSGSRVVEVTVREQP